MVDNGGQSEQEEFRGARIQVLGTNRDAPEEGRIFVWTKMGWFERLEGESGNAVTPVARLEKELREYISRGNPSVDLFPLGGKYKKMVAEQFNEQTPYRSASPEYQSEEPSGEQNEQYHQHDR
jgi:hypothetical protein